MRIIPTTMATQHPDNAGKPSWYSKPFLSTSAELNECYICFSEFTIDEYNWDWEGKYVDEAVCDRLLHKHASFFQKHPLGEKKFLTFRIPNPRVEKQFRLARAYMVIVTSSQLAQSLGYKHPPIFETILPLTETAEEIIELQEAYRQLVQIDHKLLKINDSLSHIEIIPLFEQVRDIIGSADTIKKYLRLHKKAFGRLPSYLRPYCARSDPALNSGLIPTMIALKIALSRYRDLEKETDTPMYPMVGTGSLPFRGGLNPDSIDDCLEEYAGVRTLTVQSAFRYDYKPSEVKKAIGTIHRMLPQTKAVRLDGSTIRSLEKSISWFEKPYRETVEGLASLINAMSIQVPRRRERMQHIGLFGYSRGIGRVHLPRAIPFTASLYSLGIPPEFIGTGRGIRRAVKEGIWEDIKKVYIHVLKDIERAGYFFNRDNLALLAKTNASFSGVVEDMQAIEKYCDIELGPKTSVHFEHKEISDKILKSYLEKKHITDMITRGGALRKSLG